MEKYPVFYLELDSENESFGLQDVALVEDPAIKSLFVKFSEEKQFKLAIQDKEQRIIMGPVMIPDKMILRVENNKPYYVTATKKTIFEAAQKWGRENRNNNVKLSHEATNNTPDVFFFESIVTDERRVPSVKGYEDHPEGTWFLTGKVLSDEVWESVNNGTFNGFSLEALFKMEPAAELTDEEIKMLLTIQ